MNWFSDDTITFLRGLGQNNSKAWFEAHRGDYENHYIAPAKAFIETVAGPLRALVPDIRAEPRVNGSIFRINRDIRFSKDKTPYKDHLDLWFWEGEKKTARSSFFFRLTADTLILGCGNHGFDKAGLERFRSAVAGAGDQGKPPRGVRSKRPASTSAASITPGCHGASRRETPWLNALLRFNALSAMQETDHPSELTTERFTGWCVERWRPMVPLHRWLVETL